MSSVQILHNPRCSKSRQTLQLLQDNGIEPHITEYLKHPLTEAEIKTIFEKLGCNSVLDMMRPKEAEFAQAGLDKQTITTEEGLQAIARYPKLLERPIVIKDNQARIGRPPEAVMELF
ncbi:arsenate reductase (glutaredoxin) [Salinimonas marina]|uniref:Arsenate reductase n=1 Tax=Salinimonas marina TaxID=2785918 RepID=A0A7S9DZN4_9ALTE|nr:arsenate reductase (glutaredoxin) [Salinimonas marina]QPG06883.1 arsenate reductase (glutaredoxin) [Salinimonas marina]